jgi:hypothetical protein
MKAKLSSGQIVSVEMVPARVSAGGVYCPEYVRTVCLDEETGCGAAWRNCEVTATGETSLPVGSGEIGVVRGEILAQ